MRSRTWAEIALSPEWESFWSSAEIAQIRQTTQRLINSTADLRVLSRLQSRLQLLDELQNLPKVLADRDQKIAEQAVTAEAEAGSFDLANFFGIR
jgi:hypothetical protein